MSKSTKKNQSLKKTRNELNATYQNRMLLISLYDQQKILGEQFELSYKKSNQLHRLTLTDETLELDIRKGGANAILTLDKNNDEFSKNNTKQPANFIDEFFFFKTFTRIYH